ncbi:maleylpyruvate isomerase family mycothiol-dependent enzyme [Gordonia rhizosphera]|uniref:Mycothiol-dependent maleylpyruvate isomerase metal-binding domain-containing protein n=1 Tax=Gordonia rhizosphera NBRC 16068 TaxID=1108045 RepID=K6V4P7_9ACTN|nr:maleylpyruvate isomerase family mycothiol-dependent enzyme [Gordonia rhizosphera]GAB91143.1 hypothetical protein GORHZ_125_00260 [Gordonia rhizosphera NBRC 16068]
MADNTSRDTRGFHELSLDERLTTARDGTAWFARHLAQISDADLDVPSALAGWTRKHVVAHVGYNAAALCNLVAWADTGVETPMYPSFEERNTEIEEGATLPAAALRNLFDHTAARLDEGWRHLPADRWSHEVRTMQGRTVPASETAWLRTREVWIHTVDLGSGASFAEFPEPVLVDLFDDVLSGWRRNGDGAELRLMPAGEPVTDVDPAFVGARTEVSGSLAAVVGWMCGRSTDGITTAEGVTPPRWI